MDGRDLQGKFTNGHSLAKGRPPSVFQSYKDRASHFLEKLTRSEILAIGVDDKLLDNYSSFDAMVLMQLANSLKGASDKEFAALERERLLDRNIGKATPQEGSVNINLNVFAVPQVTDSSEIWEQKQNE